MRRVSMPCRFSATEWNLNKEVIHVIVTERLNISRAADMGGLRAFVSVSHWQQPIDYNGVYAAWSGLLKSFGVHCVRLLYSGLGAGN